MAHSIENVSKQIPHQQHDERCGENVDTTASAIKQRQDGAKHESQHQHATAERGSAASNVEHVVDSRRASAQRAEKYFSAADQKPLGSRRQRRSRLGFDARWVVADDRPCGFGALRKR